MSTSFAPCMMSGPSDQPRVGWLLSSPDVRANVNVNLVEREPSLTRTCVCTYCVVRVGSFT